jgi:hypothetical protein
MLYDGVLTGRMSLRMTLSVDNWPKSYGVLVKPLATSYPSSGPKLKAHQSKQ